MSVSVWILGDQLISHHPALRKAEAAFRREDVNVLMIESRTSAERYPYHPKKLVLVFSAMRHYADALRSKGFQVDYRQAADFFSAIEDHCRDYKPERLYTMAAVNKNGKAFQNKISEKLGFPVTILENSQFLSNRYNPFPDAKPGQFIKQERFYRQMRTHFDLLMTSEGEPVGGQWNYDKQNRQPLPEDIELPGIPHFDPDPITQDVISFVQQNFDTVGEIEGFDLAVTQQEAEKVAADFIQHRLALFGTYEDAMRQSEGVLFHSKLSPYINLGLLDPLDLAQMAEQAYFEGKADLNSVEGFIRQVIGWREYIGWQYQRLDPEIFEANVWGFDRKLPTFFWDGNTSMNCLSRVIKRVLRDGYTHHIERLMILSNFCLLAEINPKAVFKWFSGLLIDAYDWVMVPNVYGMGLYADGGHVSTKPYIASANYIHKMSNFCGDCQFDHKRRVGENACPFNFLYWHFLLKHESALKENYRMARMVYNLKYLDGDERLKVRQQAEAFLMFDPME